MIAAEYATGAAIVRVHDDFCGNQVERHLARINNVVSQSYHRRTTEQKNGMEFPASTQVGRGETGIVPISCRRCMAHHKLRK